MLRAFDCMLCGVRVAVSVGLSCRSCVVSCVLWLVYFVQWVGCVVFVCCMPCVICGVVGGCGYHEISEAPYLPSMFAKTITRVEQSA